MIFYRKILKKFNIQVRNLSIKYFLRKRIHFVHIGRTGGSAIRNSLLELNSKQSKFFFCIYSHAFTCYHLKSDSKYILTIRDPIERFYSCFYARKYRNYPWAEVKKSNQGEVETFMKFEHANLLAESLNSDNLEIKKNAHLAMKSIRGVNRPYSFYFNKDFLIKNKPFFVIENKNLNINFNNFLKKLNLEPMKLTNDNVIAHKTIHKEETPKLSNLATHNLGSWYHKDIELYNFITK